MNLHFARLQVRDGFPGLLAIQSGEYKFASALFYQLKSGEYRFAFCHAAG